MTATLAFRPDDPRVRRLNDRPVNRRGDLVLYWMQTYRRAEDNAALDHAILLANELGVPCVVYEELRPDHPHASERLHTFHLQGARDVAAGLARRGVHHSLCLPTTGEQARGIVARLADRACAVVSDDFPSFVVEARHAAIARGVPCPYLVVDDTAVVPMALLGRAEIGAHTLRPKVHRLLGEWLRPLAALSTRHGPPQHLDLPFEPVDLSSADISSLVASCGVDRAVPAVLETPGGSQEAGRRLDAFVRGPLAGYATDRNDPSRDAGSGLSPYLHSGMISARRVALEARAWGRGESLEAFLEQLLVRRALAFNFARRHPDPAGWSAVPAWARASLEAHAGDEREAELSRDDLEQGRTPDELWNAAMAELRARGTIQPYARMLWGKLPIRWMRSPADAHAAIVHLNDRWALDGRDPGGYANVAWCFGLHDRPWPERPVFGKVRTMTSASARRKLDFEDYIARWSRA
ncbi:MAG TPA: deoxyribodipyrimidine photo-lyase [Polyangiaceae bacterium]